MTCGTPWFPLWIGDYIADTTHLSCEQHGAYFLLMLAYYQRGHALPDDDAYLAGIAQSSRRSWRYLRPVIAGFFQVENGFWRHKRIDAEMAEQLNRAARRSQAGSENARKRWRTGYPDENEAKSTGGDMPPACEPHQADFPRSKVQKRLANTKLSGLVDPKVNKINAPNMLQSQGRSLLLTEQRDLPPHARDATPPLPSQGDGDAALRAFTNHKSEAAAPTVFEDPALKADAIAMLSQCLGELRAKSGTLDSLAAQPPPEPRIVEFRGRLQRLNALAGSRLDGDTRMQAWEVLGQADALGDPLALSPGMLASLAAIEALDAYAETAE